MIGAQAARDRRLGLFVGVGHPSGNGHRQEGQAVLGEEECSLDGRSCPLGPGKGTENQTKCGSWGKIQGTSGQQGNSCAEGGHPYESKLSSDARPCPGGTEASGEWGWLSAVCPLSGHLNQQ